MPAAPLKLPCNPCGLSRSKKEVESATSQALTPWRLTPRGQNSSGRNLGGPGPVPVRIIFNSRCQVSRGSRAAGFAGCRGRAPACAVTQAAAELLAQRVRPGLPTRTDPAMRPHTCLLQRHAPPAARIGKQRTRRGPQRHASSAPDHCADGPWARAVLAIPAAVTPTAVAS